MSCSTHRFFFRVPPEYSRFIADRQLWTERTRSELLQVLMKNPRAGVQVSKGERTRLKWCVGMGIKDVIAAVLQVKRDEFQYSVWVREMAGSYWGGLGAFQRRIQCGITIAWSKKLDFQRWQETFWHFLKACQKDCCKTNTMLKAACGFLNYLHPCQMEALLISCRLKEAPPTQF